MKKTLIPALAYLILSSSLALAAQNSVEFCGEKMNQLYDNNIKIGQAENKIQILEAGSEAIFSTKGRFFQKERQTEQTSLNYEKLNMEIKRETLIGEIVELLKTSPEAAQEPFSLQVRLQAVSNLEAEKGRMTDALTEKDLKKYAKYGEWVNKGSNDRA